jgi:hypothetical protein
MHVWRHASFRPDSLNLKFSRVFEPLPCPDHGCAKLQLIGKHVDASNLEDQIARKGPAMMEFLFQVTLLASIRVKAETQAEAELKLRAALEASEANLGMLDDTPIVVPIEIEGDLDLIEATENAGEE